MVNVSKEGEVYECQICGNVVVVKVAGGGELLGGSAERALYLGSETVGVHEVSSSR